MVLGQESSPILTTPIERRLQTLSVLTYIILCIVAPIPCILLLVYVLTTKLAPLAVGYAAWVFYDVRIRKTSSRGGRGSDWMRRGRMWVYFRDYFPVSLVKTAELDPGRNYVFGYHPHGIIAFGAFANFATEATNFSGVFPGIKPHLLTLKSNYLFPLLRSLLLWCGVCDASRAGIERILTKQGTGNAAIVIVGGADEALEAQPGSYNIVLKKRKGFIKLAIQTGACLVPVFSFGENDLFVQVSNPHGSKVRSFQETFKKTLGFSLPLFHGRGLLPYRRPIRTVIGQPMEVEKVLDPDQSTVDRVHQQYTVALNKLFDQHKVRYGVEKDQTLNFL